MIETEKYIADPKQYKELIEEMYSEFPPVTLPPEYAYFIEKDLLRFLIRLARYKFVARMIKKTDRVLEIGSGNGLGCIFLSQFCESVLGLEVKKHEVEESRSINRRKNVTFKTQDLFDLEKSISYDVIIALDVIEHMDEACGRRLLKEMSNHLCPNGMIIIGTPSIYSYKYQSSFSKASHIKCYDQQELRSIIDEYYKRSIAFSMNDEVVHTGHPKMAWYYFILAFYPHYICSK